MSLWYYEETAPFAFSLADVLSEVEAELIRRCAPGPGEAWPEDDDDPGCDVIDLAAVRRDRAAR